MFFTVYYAVLDKADKILGSAIQTGGDPDFALFLTLQSPYPGPV